MFRNRSMGVIVDPAHRKAYTWPIEVITASKLTRKPVVGVQVELSEVNRAAGGSCGADSKCPSPKFHHLPLGESDLTAPRIT